MQCRMHYGEFLTCKPYSTGRALVYLASPYNYHHGYMGILVNLVKFFSAWKKILAKVQGLATKWVVFLFEGHIFSS